MRITPALIGQMESDITACESHTERNGSEALYSELVARYIVLDPTFRDGLSTNGKAVALGSEFDYRPELRAVASKLKMYLLMGETADNSPSPLKKRVEEFIERGERIGKDEYHPAEKGFAFSYISGPQYDAWMSEINIFNDRYLKEHPLYNSIHTVYFHRGTKPSAYRDMMGHLRALVSDDEFWKENEPKEDVKVMRSRKTIDQLLVEDIERCEQFVHNPTDEKAGLQLYVEITGRYDALINGFGNGLYQYIAEQHFYDPEIDGETLKYNLSLLLNKMISYQAINFPTIIQTPSLEEKKMSNRVFIVHGHDTEAIQEMARTLEKGGFEPIILHEQPDAGLTIIEKIERYADVCYAVVLYTECDIGRDKKAPADQEKYRARVSYWETKQRSCERFSQRSCRDPWRYQWRYIHTYG